MIMGSQDEKPTEYNQAWFPRAAKERQSREREQALAELQEMPPDAVKAALAGVKMIKAKGGA
jgi:hypothetical protein